MLAWQNTKDASFKYTPAGLEHLTQHSTIQTHKQDPTRPAAIGGAQRGDVDKPGDVAGSNGDGARLFIDPGVPNMVSEYGAISKPHDAYDPFLGELQNEHFPWRAGEAIWCGFDYGSIAGKQGLKGICDHAPLPKQSWTWDPNHNFGLVPSANPA